jgi:hypothetical protein
MGVTLDVPVTDTSARLHASKSTHVLQGISGSPQLS